MMVDPENESLDRRRIDREFREWRSHVDGRLNKQDEVLQEIAGYLRASRWAAEVIKWLAVVGAGLAGVWGALHLGGPK